MKKLENEINDLKLENKNLKERIVNLENLLDKRCGYLYETNCVNSAYANYLEKVEKLKDELFDKINN